MPPPVPFGDPTVVRRDNASAVGKGVFLGCGGCALLAIVLPVAVFVLLFALGVGATRNSDVAALAMAKVNASAEVRSKLGTPLEQTWGTNSSNFNINGSESTAQLTFSISGPKGSALVEVSAQKERGAWVLKKLKVIPSDKSKPIDLFAPLNVTYNWSISLPWSPSKPPLLNTMITSPDLVCDFKRSMIASVVGS